MTAPAKPVPQHWCDRVAERIGPETDASLLWETIRWALAEDRRDIVRFEARSSRDGRRWFRFWMPDGRDFFALINTEAWVPITVQRPGDEARRQGKRSILLGDHTTRSVNGKRRSRRRKPKGV